MPRSAVITQQARTIITSNTSAFSRYQTGQKINQKRVYLTNPTQDLLKVSSPFIENLSPLLPFNLGSASKSLADARLIRINGISSPFIEKTHRLPEHDYTQELHSGLPPIKPGYARLVHGTSSQALESIKKHGIIQPLYITSNIKEAETYARKQSEFDGSEQVLIIIDAKNIQKNEYDKYFTFNGKIQLTIPVAEKEQPEYKLELDVISKANHDALKAQVTGVAVLMSSPVAINSLMAIIA